MERLQQGKIIIYCLACALGAGLINSCRTIYPTHPTGIQQAQVELQKGIEHNQHLAATTPPDPLPEAVNNALLPPLTTYVKADKKTEDTFDVNASNIPAREFFTGLVAGTKYNMVIHPKVAGNISLNLKNVTLGQTMDAVRDIYGFEYHKTSYGYEVLPPQLETQLFHINYLDVQRIGKSFTQLTTGQVSNKVSTVSMGGSNTNGTPTVSGDTSSGTGTISSIETKSEMQFWKDIDKAIRGMLPSDADHNVTVNAQAGIVSVRGFPAELKHIGLYIDSLQNSLNRQVILEAKILEVQLNDTYQAGIDWGVLSNPAVLSGTPSTTNVHGGIGQLSNQVFPDTDLKLFDGIFAIRINGNFRALINLLQTQGNVQVLSSPHLATVNNQKAVIKVGSDEFFVTGVSTTNSVVGTNTLPSQDVSLTPFFSGITLDVTPEISKDDTVVLHIHPSVSKVIEQTKEVKLGSSANGTPNNLELPLAFSTIRESDNIVRAKNGQVVVIGGLMQNDMKETTAATPGLSKMPFIGSFFRRTRQESKKIELVILLRPIISTNKEMITQLQDAKKTFQIMRRPFHAGGLPKIFGNEAERGDNE